MNQRVLVSMLLAMMILAPSALAGSYELLRVEHIRMPDWDVRGMYPIRVQLSNGGSRIAEDVHVRSWMPTFSDRPSGMINEVDLSNEGKTLIQTVPGQTPKGEYWVRITVSNDNERRVKHRIVWVD